jgi:Vitamin-D-receptor interacting Mediator subunit 4
MTVDDAMDGSDELSLLDKVEAALRVEQKLTVALDRAGAWLEGAPVRAHQRRVRPVPHTMEQAEHVLKYARVLSNRTSAPAGWNPNAPVVGFSTPNPLPHQLRGGALAALQLERARDRQVRQQQQLERSHKILHDREESDKEKMMVVENEKGQGEAQEDAAGDGTSRDPKRRDVVAHQQQDSAAAAAASAPGAGQQRGGGAGAGATAAAAAAAAQRPVASQLDVSMNLSSDSDSSEEEDDEEG